MKSFTAATFATLLACILGAPESYHGAKVLGGTNAEPGEFPWMVSLRKSNSHICGGSIISASVVMTACHCVYGTLAASITVVSGTNSLQSGGNSHKVTKITTHPDYNGPDSWVNDVALLKLESPMTWTALEQPVRLPSQNEDAGDNDNVSSRVSGWGYTSYPSASLPNDLQKVDMYLVSNSACNEAHSIPVYPSHICAGTISGEGVCNGDSGGPLVVNGTQVGIVSWGRPCAIGYPDVFTRVASYADWIATNSV